MGTPLIEIKNLSAGYDSRTVLRNVNLTVYDRDFLGIIGPNGGGKTTLIKCITVPTFINTGVSITPWTVVKRPLFALPSFLINSYILIHHKFS